MVRGLLVAMLCLSASSALCQEIDYKTTKARVTYVASTFWVEGVGPLEGVDIKIQGEINRDAGLLIKQYYERIKGLGSVNIHLDSPGGDVAAAFEIGRFTRSIEANVMVTGQARCASACLFVLAGGVYRTVSGSLGIHRPFLETPSRPVTKEDVRNASVRTMEKLRAYFREMNISERLADDMMMIPSSEMKWLSPQEVAVYGLGVDDPVVKETKSLMEAQKYGLSRVEYELRWRRVREICTLGSAPDCREQIMRGR